MRKRAQQALRYTHFTPATHPALCALVDYAAQNPGLDWRNYGSWPSYRSEASQITRQWHAICDVLRIADHYTVTDAQIIAASQWAYSGRLTWTGTDWTYCCGQYWPTEYRTATLAVLRAAIREHELEVNDAADA
ncbi:MAG TPA: hypothetical protein PLZ36_03680 [Armatimonadota bacterium]|nr:hypothetical protein [Armatimonadota bacterium]